MNMNVMIVVYVLCWSYILNWYSLNVSIPGMLDILLDHSGIANQRSQVRCPQQRSKIFSL
jgi:hypothetical protein